MGCCTASLISPTTMRVNGGATGRSDSTSKPPMVRVSASACVDSGGLQNARNQDWGNCMTDLDQRNWLRKRMSPSKNRRKSFTP